MESLIRVFVFLFVLVLTVSSTWAATANIFMLSDERAGLITMRDTANTAPAVSWWR